MSPVTEETLALVERLAEDMARRWRRGERPLAEEYLAQYPGLCDRPEAALELISEELYLRQESGQGAAASDLVGRFPQWRRQVRALLGCHNLLAPHLQGPRFPAAGETLGDFRLLAELGRGAHARVFLATQPALADRPVVLKLGPGAGGEHLSLARLQHTHIVPLHSIHDFPARGLRGLCLPYFGGATLAGLLESLGERPPAQRTGADLLEALRRARAAAPVAVEVGGPACRFLARASYVQAVCWVGACLAEALQYAHERGLVHLDLKPSNVLLAADGQPMLLDFHLAREPLPAAAPAPPGLGGTPGYMAPEHRAALDAACAGRAVPAAVDGRADVYSLGVLLYEMLGGTLPGPGPARALRGLNPRVTAGLADLLARCLAPDPLGRYPTAAGLAADLRRHLADLPLRGVANRSPVERWRKWRRRRPHALPLLGLLLASLMAAGSFAAHAGRQADRARTALREGEDHLSQGRYAEALDAFGHGTALAEDLPFHAGLAGELREWARRAEQGQAARELHLLCERVRPLYAAEPLPAEQARAVAAHCRTFWDNREVIARRLGGAAPELRQQVRADLLDLAILWAHFHVRAAPRDGAPAARREALDVLARAEALLGPSCVLHQERRAHARALGWEGVAAEAGRRAEALPPRTAWEHYALGRAHLHAGDLERALSLMDRALELQPQALWPNFYKGSCSYRLGQYQDAVVAFSVCVVLAPRSAWCFYNRGLANLKLRRLDRARHDFDRALGLDPGHRQARELLARLRGGGD